MSRVLFTIALQSILTLAAKPNIVFLMTDSMDGRNLDPTHSQYNLMNMPNLRRIANLGTQFINTYTNGPICVVGRACLLTGRRTDHNKAYNNNMGFGMSSDGVTVDKYCVGHYNESTCINTFGALQNLNYTLVDAMQDVGYDVYLYGKLDIGAGILQKPSSINVTADGFHEGPSLITLTRSANINKAHMTNPTKLVNDTDDNVYPQDWSTAHKCVDRLNTLGQGTNSTKPFFLYCSINIPHPPFDTNETWLDQVDIASIPFPKWNNESIFHPYDQYMSIIKNVWGNFSDSDIENVRKTYYAMNVEADYIFGLVINASIVNGFDLSNTIFVYTSDHGEMNMEHRQIWKNTMYEGSTRIPLFFSGTGIEQSIVNDPTQIIDILPTLINIGGDDVPSWLDGYSLTQYFGDKYTKSDMIHPDYITAQYHARNGNTATFMVRREEWKYITFGKTLSRYENYTALLYNLNDDPGELTNLDCTDDEYKGKCNELQGILDELYDTQYIDCEAKKMDHGIFEEYYWNVYNQSKLYDLLRATYHGFDANDWQAILKWRSEMNSINCFET